MIKTVKATHILLPRNDVDWSKYAVIACDQYTSNVEYWNTLKWIIYSKGAIIKILA